MSRDRAVLVVHGGAGVTDGHDYAAPTSFLKSLLERGGKALAAGIPALDLVVHMVAALEESGLYTAGKGSAANAAGEVELDASLMNGPDRRAGAVAAVRNVLNPVRLARGVMERSPHVMLAGLGAEAFADREGFERVTDPGNYYRSAMLLTRRDGASESGDPLAHGTVGAVVRDVDGHLAAATSTGGTLKKLHGRIGDTPLIGAATWADERVAVSCTGKGEFFIRVAAAHDVAARMAYAGETLEVAGRAAIDAVGGLGGDGGLIAVDRDGNVAMPFNSGGMKRGVVRVGGVPEVAVR